MPDPRSADDAAIFGRLYPELRRFAAIWAPASVDPDDLLQQAVANALARQPLHALKDPGAYLRTTIANLARNEYRQQRTSNTDAPTGSSDVYPSDLSDLDELSPDERGALYLVDVEGTPLQEAARTLGCSTAALKTRAIRARRKLRKILDTEEP